MKRGEPLTREVCVRMTEAEYQRLDACQDDNRAEMDAQR